MTRDQRTALEQLRGEVDPGVPQIEIRSRLTAILALPEPDHTALIERLNIADSVIFGITEGNVYQVSDAIREAITALRGEGE